MTSPTEEALEEVKQKRLSILAKHPGLTSELLMPVRLPGIERDRFMNIMEGKEFPTDPEREQISAYLNVNSEDIFLGFPDTRRGAANDYLVREKAVAAWENDTALQAEFGGNFNDYLAYENACANGQVKILGANVT